MSKSRARETFLKRTTVRLFVPRLPYQELKEAVLGKRFALSLAFVSPAESRRLNTRLRKKNKPANVLSFPLSKTSGEILITPSVAKREAPLYGLSYTDFVASLFIHGLFHLKGLRHGSTMESEERRIATRFGFSSTTR